MSEETKDLLELEKLEEETEELSPAVYFDHVKSSKKKFNRDDQQLILDQTLTMMKKCKITGQTEMAKQLAYRANLALRELDAANKGFDIYVSRKDVEKYVDQIEKKSVKVIELRNYTREIPDEHIEKIEAAQNIFDELYIFFTDYTMEETKKVAKERRKKDPIVFGAFIDKLDGETKPYVEDKMFFICDWVEENCDLTLEQIVNLARNKDKKEITYRVESVEDVEAAKKLINSFTDDISEFYEPVSIFDKVKAKVTKKEVEPKKISKKDAKYSCECGKLLATKYSPRKCKECNTRLKKIDK